MKYDSEYYVIAEGLACSCSPTMAKASIILHSIPGELDGSDTSCRNALAKLPRFLTLLAPSFAGSLDE